MTYHTRYNWTEERDRLVLESGDNATLAVRFGCTTRIVSARRTLLKRKREKDKGGVENKLP